MSLNRYRILVTGGQGYIGSYMCKLLHMKGFEVCSFDNNSTGNADVSKYANVIHGDLHDVKAIDKLFSKNSFDAVIHFAGSSIVSESIDNPHLYYQNNINTSLNLLNIMIKNKVSSLIFSSTAAIFGNPIDKAIDENHPKNPINPYGVSKLIIEDLIKSYCSYFDLDSVCLRYFNACGCDPDYEFGENHEPETHLIPLILGVASGRFDCFSIYGDSYDTRDGTCIRDFIHIHDLCYAHYLSLQKLLKNELSGINYFNLGNGDGYSVQEVLDCAKKIVSKDRRHIKHNLKNPRLGDPATLISNSESARKILNWIPRYTSLDTLIEHAWNWEKRNNKFL